MAESKSLKKAVKSEMKDATKNANEGNLETVPQNEGGPNTDIDPVDRPTGERSHPPEPTA